MVKGYVGVQRKKGWKGGMGGPGFYDCGGARFFSVGPWEELSLLPRVKIF